VPRSIQAAMYHPIPMSLRTPAHLLSITERDKIITHVEEKAQWAEVRFIHQLVIISLEKSSPNILTRQRRYAKSGAKWRKVGRSACYWANMS
jgi:hypothetical protein